MKKIEYSQDTIAKVCDMYDRGCTYKEIFDATGLNNPAITKIAKEAGCKARIVRGESPRVCNNRGEAIKPTFRFCPHCGKDVRSDKDILIEQINDIFGMLHCLPEGSRDATRDTLNNAIAYIRRAR